MVHGDPERPLWMMTHAWCMHREKGRPTLVDDCACSGYAGVAYR